MTLRQLYAARLALSFATILLGAFCAWETAMGRLPAAGALLAIVCALSGVVMAEGPRMRRLAA